jgi:hypothetical protein
VFQKQDEIGWQSLAEGDHRSDGAEAVKRNIGTGLRWLTYLIQQLWDIAWGM